MVGPHNTTMSGCTLRFTRNSFLQTTLVNEATGHAIYQIDTSASVTRIRKFDTPQPHPHRVEGATSGSDNDITNKGGKGKPKSKEDEEGDETETMPESPEISHEIARIYRKWFSLDRIIFRGKITTRRELMPAASRKVGGG